MTSPALPASKPMTDQQRRKVFSEHLHAAVSALDMRNAYRGPMAPDREILTSLVEYLEKSPAETTGHCIDCIELKNALAAAVKVANEARECHDRDQDMRTMKLLIALSGHRPKWRADTDRIHDVLRRAVERLSAPMPPEEPSGDESNIQTLERTAHPAAQVAGDRLETTVAQFVMRAQHLLIEEQEKPNPDNALVGFLCDAVRLAREHSREATAPIGRTWICPVCRYVSTARTDSPTKDQRTCPACIGTNGNHESGCHLAPPSSKTVAEIVRHIDLLLESGDEVASLTPDEWRRIKGAIGAAETPSQAK